MSGLNVDGGRIGLETLPEAKAGQSKLGTFERSDMVTPERIGRWPANILHDGSPEALSVFPEVGDSRQGSPRSGNSGDGWGMTKTGIEYNDQGSAARFFYCAKSSSEERNEGLEGLPKRKSGMNSENSGQHITRRDGHAPGPRANHHPTVKPLELMRYLVRLAKMPQRPGYRQQVLDIFAGSGTTGVACIWEDVDAVLIEKTPEYVEIIKARCAHAIKEKAMQPELFDTPHESEKPTAGNLELFE